MNAARSWAAEKGLPLDDTLRDIGVSAHKGRNKIKGALAGFLRSVEEGTVKRGSILCIENMDRLSREKPLAALDTLRDLLRAGIVVVPLDLGWELDEESLKREPWRLQALLTMMERAHNESATKSRRGLQGSQTRRLGRIRRGSAASPRARGWHDLVVEDGGRGRRWAREVLASPRTLRRLRWVEAAAGRSALFDLDGK